MTVPSADVKTAQAPDDLTPAQALANAIAMRPKILAAAAETEERTFHSEELHIDFVEAGFYNMLRPRMFGGYEFDLDDYFKVVRELARADMATAWCLCLSAGHNLQFASWWPEKAQRELYGDGHFAAPMTGAPSGKIRRSDDGWILNSVAPYASGIPYATHVMGHVFVDNGPGAPGPLSTFIVPRSDTTVRDDWGQTLGLRGSGSHTVEIAGVTVPEHWVLEGQQQDDINTDDGTPGLRLHGNPLYGGRGLSFFGIELASLAIGGVYGALDEYEQLLRTKKTHFPPFALRGSVERYQMWYADAVTTLASADASRQRACDMFREITHRAASGGQPFTRAEDIYITRLAAVALQTSWQALQGVIMRTAGTTAASTGQRLERIWRDSTMVLSHAFTVRQEFLGAEYAASVLGAPTLA